MNANGFSEQRHARYVEDHSSQTRLAGLSADGSFATKHSSLLAYEGLRFHRAYNYLLMTVPTAAESNGRFQQHLCPRRWLRAVPIRILRSFQRYPSWHQQRLSARTQFPTFTDAQGVVRTLSAAVWSVINPFGLRHPQRVSDRQTARRTTSLTPTTFSSTGNQQFTKNNLNSRVDYNRGRHSFYATYGFQKRQ